MVINVKFHPGVHIFFHQKLGKKPSGQISILKNSATLVLHDWNDLILIAWVSDCVFNAKLAIFQLYHGENKLIFKEMMMRSALY